MGLQHSRRMRSSVLLSLSALLLTGTLMAVGCSDDVDTSPTKEDGGSIADAQGAADAAGQDAASPDTSTTPDAAAGDSGGGADAKGAPTPLGAGPYTIAYASIAAIGIDARTFADGKATFDGVKLLSYESGANEMPTVGSNQTNEPNGDAFALIGRWSGGTTGGKFYNVGGTGLAAIPANGGFHYVIGRLADPLPTSGAASYVLTRTTAATLADGSVAVGTTTGTLAADYGTTSKVGFSVVLDVGGVAYTITTTGGTANVATSQSIFASGTLKAMFANNLEVTAPTGPCATAGTCKATANGVVAGPNGERFGLVVSAATGTGAPRALGALVFTKQ